MKKYNYILIFLILLIVSCSDNNNKEEEVISIPEIVTRLPLENGTFHYYKVYQHHYGIWVTGNYSTGEVYISKDYKSIKGFGDSFNDGRKSGESLIANKDEFEYYFAKTKDGEVVIVWHRFDDGAMVFYFI